MVKKARVFRRFVFCRAQAVENAIPIVVREDITYVNILY